jgi:predicted DNA-binding protein with PD1-like motif
MLTHAFTASRFVALRLNPGEDVLLSLRDAVREHGIRNGVFVSGVGSLSRYHYHVVKTTNDPPGNTYIRGDGPFDILAVTGMVLDGKVHAHITFSNSEVAMGGHMEEGCRVLTFAMVVLVETRDADFAGWDDLKSL